MSDLVTSVFSQPSDINGVPLAGAKLFFYITGTSTLSTVNQDGALTTPHTNPVIADASGIFPPIYQSAQVHKVILKTSADVTVYTVDPFSNGTAEFNAFDVETIIALSTLGVPVTNPVVLRTILTDIQTSRMLSGTGGGSAVPADVTAETLKFQTMIDQGRSFSIPEPPVTYRVGTLTMVNGQTIEGCGQFNNPLDAAGGPYTITGTGPTVFTMGDGDGNPRQMTLKNLSVTNSGKIVVGNTAPNLTFRDCRLDSTGDTAIDLAVCYRALLDNCWIHSVGANKWAVRAINNVNQLDIVHCTISGGTAGGAIQIEQSQGIRICGNAIESSLHGIWVSSTNDAGLGNCNGVIVDGNYIEQCSTPIVLGKVLSVIGGSVRANYIGNLNRDIVAARSQSILAGRCLGVDIVDNSIYLSSAGDEDPIGLWIPNISGNISNCNISRNRISGTPLSANGYFLGGAFGANDSVLRNLGSENYFSFANGNDSRGSENVSEFVSSKLAANVALAQSTWLPKLSLGFGGGLKSAEIIEYDGGTLTGCSVTAGTAISANSMINTLLTTLTFVDGCAQLPLVTTTPLLSRNENNTYRTVAGAGTGTFRVRFRYRVN